ncbi:para-aminobenzoate synthase component I [Striga asiatica]|uniref:Para-aminobenzoate synthase component I n=1 Tax=Striga asiatica TaxID=4170 RepID=A0A5A7QDT3_STRAF|nr:para-aminobenzoate synthase component I [Striga asiatica]
MALSGEFGAFRGEEHQRHLVELAWRRRRGGEGLWERLRAAGPNRGEQDLRVDRRDLLVASGVIFCYGGTKTIAAIDSKPEKMHGEKKKKVERDCVRTIKGGLGLTDAKTERDEDKPLQ